MTRYTKRPEITADFLDPYVLGEEDAWLAAYAAAQVGPGAPYRYVSHTNYIEIQGTNTSSGDWVTLGAVSPGDVIDPLSHPFQRLAASQLSEYQVVEPGSAWAYTIVEES